MNKIQKIQTVFVACLLLFVAMPAFAAEFGINSESQTIGIDEKFKVEFILNTEDEDINAVEGAIIFPQELLELKEISDGNSTINFWVERPTINNGKISFSGIIPGGYSGKKGLILSLVFQTRQEGSGVIDVHNFAALKNDGKGTAADVRASHFLFLISKEAPTEETTAD